MLEYTNRLFQCHIDNTPSATMCFAQTEGAAQELLLPNNAARAHQVEVLIFDATESWLRLSGELGRATREALAAGLTGIATYIPDDDGMSCWVAGIDPVHAEGEIR